MASFLCDFLLLRQATVTNGPKWSGCCADDIGASAFPPQQREEVQMAVEQMKGGLCALRSLHLHSGDNAVQNACKEVMTALDGVAEAAGRLEELH
jgi:hypothetical protein